MPLATLHLISLKPTSNLQDILGTIKSTSSQHQPIILSKPIRWVILPEQIDKQGLLSPKKPWDLLYIHLGNAPLPADINSHMHDHYSLQVGIPSRLLKDFPTTNQGLLHPSTETSVPKLTGALDKPNLTGSSQDLTLSKELQEWITSFSQTRTGRNAVSMLNLLAFHPDKKASYITYGQQFAESIGSKRGGNAKLVGHVVYDSPASSSSSATKSKTSNSNAAEKPAADEARWEEFALAHYPSILHFADMLASNDYQAVNQKFRVPALKDTCILCTSEVEIEDLLRGSGSTGAAKPRL